MKRSIITSLVLAIAFSFGAMAQKGPAYKNAKPSEKYDGTSVVKLRVDPNSVKGHEAKNQRFADFKEPKTVMTASLDSNEIASEKKYKEVDVKSSDSKYTKGLKGPKFKNYRGK